MFLKASLKKLSKLSSAAEPQRDFVVLHLTVHAMFVALPITHKLWNLDYFNVKYREHDSEILPKKIL